MLSRIYWIIDWKRIEQELERELERESEWGYEMERVLEKYYQN